jgi:hypothetical protein
VSESINIADIAIDKVATFGDGSPICVARPTNQALALQIAKEEIGGGDEQWAAAQKRLDEECGPYTFVGFLGKNHNPRPCIVSETGKRLGYPEPGDSFVAINFWKERDNG